MSAPDTLGVIRSRFLRLTKAIHADGRIQDYDQARTIDLHDVPVAGLDDIGALLLRLLPHPACAVVFGGIVDPARTRRVRRLAYPDPETADQATLGPVPHRWCALDMDGIARPVDVPATDLAACAALAIERLPPPFHSARCIVQASAGHGLKPGFRLRLWFWLDRSTSGAELGFWLDRKRFPVDPCTFRPAQPIYTAAPVFIRRSDHLPCRIAYLPGAAAVAVPGAEKLKPPPRVEALPTASAASSDDVRAFIDEILARVRTARDNSKHYTLRASARLLGGIQAKAGFSDSEAVRWLVDSLPSTALDLGLAKKTAEWGLEVGRVAPILVPPQRRERQPPDPRRQETARAAFRLLRQGAPSADLLAELHTRNNRRSDLLAAGSSIKSRSGR
jgi:hypothetical protein